MLSFSASIPCLPIAGRSTRKYDDGRRTCFRERRDQTAGAAAQKRAAAPATPTFSADQTTCRSCCNPADHLDLGRGRHEPRSSNSTYSAFHGSRDLFRAESSAEQRGPAGEPAAGGLARVLPQRLFS